MKVALRGLAALLTSASFACSGDASPLTPTPTLLPPEISPALRVVGEGTLLLDIPPGGRQPVRPIILAEQFGPPPDCARLAALFRWRIDGGADVRFEGWLRGATIHIEKGNTGSFSVGCMDFDAVNDGRRRVTGDMRYYIAEPH